MGLKRSETQVAGHRSQVTFKERMYGGVGKTKTEDQRPKTPLNLKIALFETEKNQHVHFLQPEIACIGRFVSRWIE